MPRVKFDYVVSFSSEDPDNPASNLLAWEISKRKWLCNKWEPSCSVVLQLTKAVQIQSVHIGAYQSSLVEVLVGLSEKPNDPFEVLVPSCVFVAPGEARRGAGERVRTFGAEQLAAARHQRWDRLRLVCTQPYSKQYKYGLSFVHVFSPEGDSKPPSAPITECIPEKAPKAIPSRMFTLDGLSSDEEEFKPGELFAKRQAGESTSTDAQIRHASSNALKNISDSSTKLTKTPIAKISEARHKNTVKKLDSEQTNRQRDSLLYTDDDDRPHAKIDKIVQNRKDEKSKEDIDKRQTSDKDKGKCEQAKKTNETKRNKANERIKGLSDEIDKEVNQSIRKDLNESASTSNKRKRDSLNESIGRNIDEKKNYLNKMKRDRSADKDESHKRKKVENYNGPLRAGPVCSPRDVLAGVTFAMSGYANPRRGSLRDCALSLGARYLPDYSRDCTHLICAFSNTPKLKAVRAIGKPCIAVKGEWLEQCAAAGRRLPEQWFATEPKFYVPPPPGGFNDDAQTSDKPSRKTNTNDRRQDNGQDDNAEETGGSEPPRRKDIEIKSRGESDIDTEDEIEEVRQEQAKREEQKPAEKETNRQTECSDSDVSFVCDERVRASVTLHTDSDNDSDHTEPDTHTLIQNELDDSKLLPEFLDGYTFVISEALRGEGAAPEMLARYVQAYGGHVMPEEEVDEESEVHYIVCSSVQQVPQCAGVRVSPRWLWRAHTDKRRPDDSDDDIQ